MAVIASVRDYAIFMLDPLGCVLTWNEGARATKGYEADEIIGQSFVRFFLPEDVSAGRPFRLLETARQTGRAEDHGWRVRKDGSRFWADVIITALRDSEGSVQGFLKVTRDMTDRKRLQEELEARVRQQAAIARLGLTVLRTPDLDEALRYVVDAVAETLHAQVTVVYELVERDGRRSLVRRADHGGDADSSPPSVAERGAAERALTSTEPVINVAHAPGDAGAPALTSSVHVGIPGVVGGQPYGAIGVYSSGDRTFSVEDVHFVQAVSNLVASLIARDHAEARMHAAQLATLAERADAERAREAVGERDEFIAVAAHELRTPLTALLLKVQGLRTALRKSPEGPLHAKLESRVDGAIRQTQRLADLVERLLDVSRIVSGRLEMKLEECDLAEIVDEALEDYREPARIGQVALEVSLDPNATGRWDRVRIGQVFVNLLSNAIKYGAGQPVQVEVASEGSDIRLRVRDHGIGVSEEDQQRIFGRFERATQLRHYAGLGLGLYITRHIVEAHGGTITLTSREGEGSTFDVVLPRVAPAAASARHAPAEIVRAHDD